jgi:malonate transporter
VITVSSIVVLKLLAIFAVIGLGWTAGRTRLLGPQAASVLGQAAFGLFTPALLFRTTAGISVASLPWTMLTAYFVPTLLAMITMYGWQRARRPSAPALPPVRALSVTFSNSVQLGIPVVTAIFGAAGLALHVAIVSLQALILLSTATVLAEIDLARARQHRPGERQGALRVVGNTARRSLIHPVVLPILLGLGFNATGLPIPAPVDDVLVLLGQAVIPVSLVTIGLTLQLYGLAGSVRPAVALALGKLVVQPAVVLAFAYGVGLRGLPLVIAVMCAALPIGSNVLLFADRYDVQQAETTAAIVASTTGYLVTGTAWLLIVSAIAL